MGSIFGRRILDGLRRLGFSVRAVYDSKDFWNQTYAAHGRHHFEWAGVGFAQLAPDLVAKLPRNDDSVLVVGAGTSRLGADMRDAGWQVTQLDFSEVAAVRDDPTWVLGDARTMTFDADFGSVVDKGTIDAMYLSANEDHEASIRSVVAGAARALKPHGTFVVFSLSQPFYVWPLLLGDSATGSLWRHHDVQRLDALFMYTLQRNSKRAPRRPNSS